MSANNSGPPSATSTEVGLNEPTPTHEEDNQQNDSNPLVDVSPGLKTSTLSPSPTKSRLGDSVAPLALDETRIGGYDDEHDDLQDEVDAAMLQFESAHANDTQDDQTGISDDWATALATERQSTTHIPFPYSEICDDRVLQYDLTSLGEGSVSMANLMPEVTTLCEGALNDQVVPSNERVVLPARPWEFGHTINVCCVTWNMNQKNPPTPEDLETLLQPCAHIIVVTTQENGPYIGANTAQENWQKTMSGTLKHAMKKNIEALKKAAQEAKENRREFQRLRTESTLLVYQASDNEPIKEGTENKNEKEPAKEEKGQGRGDDEEEEEEDLDYSHLHYRMISQKHMCALHMAVYCRKDVAMHVQNINATIERRGTASIGFKGAVAIEFTIGDAPSCADAFQEARQNELERLSQQTVAPADENIPYEAHGPTHDRANPYTRRRFATFLCIGAHLTAHLGHVEQRNEDYRAIMNSLGVGSKGPYPWLTKQRDLRRHPPYGRRHLLNRDASDEFDFVIFAGDLNYRINGEKRPVEEVIRSRPDLRTLLVAHDQLRLEKRKGNIFHGFAEGALDFKPTYKFDVDKATGLATDTYDTSAKGRIAAFCDRILYKRHPTYPGRAQLVHYGCVKTIRTSDHLPVLALLSLETCSEWSSEPYSKERLVEWEQAVAARYAATHAAQDDGKKKKKKSNEDDDGDCCCTVQ